MSTRISTAGQPFQAAPQHAWFRRLMAWARGNLFPTPFDAALNLVIVALFAWLVASMLPWALLDATERERLLDRGAGHGLRESLLADPAG